MQNQRGDADMEPWNGLTMEPLPPGEEGGGGHGMELLADRQPARLARRRLPTLRGGSSVGDADGVYVPSVLQVQRRKRVVRRPLPLREARVNAATGSACGAFSATRLVGPSPLYHRTYSLGPMSSSPGGAGCCGPEKFPVGRSVRVGVWRGGAAGEPIGGIVLLI